MQDTPQMTFPNLPPRLSGLGELSANLWWSWHPSAIALFKMINRTRWRESGHNPVSMLRYFPAEDLLATANDPDVPRRTDVVLSQFRNDVGAKGGWFSNTYGTQEPSLIAYFSAEYGLHHSLPSYAGGLGFLAGDHIKECSDLGVPLVAVGFMYQEGYLHQQIDEDGWQKNLNAAFDRNNTPVTRVLDSHGEQLIVRVPVFEPAVHVAVWKLVVGRVTLYLMDTNIPQNDPANRQTYARLYTGDIEQRLRQEIVLGVGGSQVLSALGIKHTVLHLNEGHPAFALLERIRERVESGMSFNEAAEQVRRTSVFTTHTPVPAGHDTFPHYLMDRYFSHYWPLLGLDRDKFMQLGAHPSSPDAGFNMTAFSLKMTSHHNGVSQKHGEVARGMWQSLWPDLPVNEVPIDHVTNGVHVPTWIAPRIEQLFNKYLGPNWRRYHDDPLVWEMVEDIPDDELWDTHYRLKAKLIDFIREQARERWANDKLNPANVLAGGALLEPSVLTIGFARRFATYKRADLILRDMARLKRIVNNPWRPVQFIFAGKAHPNDDPGKMMLQRIFNAARDPEMGGRIAFVEDYDELLAQHLVHGVDVWLNNPLSPLEASGTSGMKAAVNGVPNLSILDGWWIEGYNGKNGWAFGGLDSSGNRDDADANAIYDILENEIVPLFYRWSDDAIPHEWVKVMKESMKSNGPRFSARRMVKQYTERFYAPALGSAEPQKDLVRIP